MSDIYLFTVIDAFALSGKLTLVPGLPQNPELPTIRVGAQLRLVTPEGISFESEIAGFQKISYGRKQARDKICLPISLPAAIAKTQVPVGTQVFLATSKTT